MPPSASASIASASPPEFCDLRKPDDIFANVLAHQSLQHEGEQGQCVGLALDIGLQLLHQRRIKHWRVGSDFAAQDFRRLANNVGRFRLAGPVQG